MLIFVYFILRKRYLLITQNQQYYVFNRLHYFKLCSEKESSVVSKVSGSQWVKADSSLMPKADFDP